MYCRLCASRPVNAAIEKRPAFTQLNSNVLHQGGAVHKVTEHF